MRTILLMLLGVMLPGAALLTGCGSEDAERQSSAQQVEWDVRLADQARLIDHLPDDTWAYARVPSIWGLLGAPKGGSLDMALGSKPNQQAIEALQQNLRRVLENDFQAHAPVLLPLLEQLRSPLEVAFSGDAAYPMDTAIMISGRFAFDSDESLNETLGGLAGLHPALSLIHGVEDNEPGLMVLGPSELHVHFNVSDQRLTLVGGMAVDGDRSRFLVERPATSDRSVHEFEQRIDESRQGMFVWADTEQLRPFLEQAAPADQLARLQAIGVLATEELAFGFGTSGGQGQMALLARGDGGIVWDIAPRIPPMPKVEIAGDPKLIIGGVVPDYAWVERLVGSLSTRDADELKEELAEADEAVRGVLGLGVGELVDMFAGRIFYIGDDNGGYLVHGGLNGNDLAALLERLGEHVGLRTHTRAVGRNNREIHHVAIPSLAWPGHMDDEEEGEEAVLNSLIAMFTRMDTHFYWMAEDDHVVMASVPQVLMDRINHPLTTSLDAWFGQAGQVNDQALLLVGMQVDGAARRNYYGYLGGLLGLADMLGHPLDLMAFPSARDLDLARHGAVGLRVDYSDGLLGLSWIYENHPGDFLFSGRGSTAMLATAGILAAIAVPAYHDYIARARVQLGMTEAFKLKNSVELFVFDHGRLPQDDEIEFPGDPASGWVDYSLSTPDTALISVEFEPAPGLEADAELWLEITQAPGEPLHWACYTRAIADKHLPAGCDQP